jgi:hypothetical protein
MGAHLLLFLFHLCRVNAGNAVIAENVGNADTDVLTED